MRGKVWICSFVLVLSLAIIIVFNPDSQSFTGITIEMLGAFIGVFAAVSLGEVIKVFEGYLVAARVRKNLTSEIRGIVKSIKKKSDLGNEFNTFLWDATIAAGELAKLDRNLLLFFYAAYNAIDGHNITTRQCENWYNQVGVSSEKKDSYLQRIVASQRQLGLSLEGILEKLRLNQIEDTYGFFSS